MRLRDSIGVILASAFVGAVIGYGITYLVYQPKLNELQTQVSQLTAETYRLSTTITEQRTRVYIQEAQIDVLGTQKSQLQTKLDKAQTEVSEYKAQAATLRSQLSASSAQLSSLRKRTEDILGITVNQNYQWDYGLGPWQWELPIPLSVYVQYREKERPRSGAYYVDMAKDAGDDMYIDQMVKTIDDATLNAGFSDTQKLNFVIAFVQSLPYTVDNETTPYDEYPRYPVETLFDRGGDCEDTSVLVAALLDRMGYDAALLLLQDAQHMAVGVSLSNAYGSYYEYNGKKYYYLETTGEGWEIGQIPLDIANTEASIYPIRN